MRYFDVSTVEDLELLGLVLADVKRHTDSAGVEILLVGAAARDVLIRHATGSLPLRATRDVDIAVAVSSWSSYENLASQFSRRPGPAHRFFVDDVDVDVVAFGGVESTERTITWPDEITMNVLGFREAYDCAVDVVLPGGVHVHVASLPAQAALKVQAWRDRRWDTTRDAVDLRIILVAYSEGLYLDELYDGAEDLLAAEGFDPQLAGAHRVGRDIGRDLGDAVSVATLEVLQADGESIVGDMFGLAPRNRELLRALADGLRAEL